MWEDPWLEGRRLKSINPELYLKAENTNARVGELPRSQNGRLVWVGTCEDNLDEEEVRREEELKVRIQITFMKENVKDKWSWSNNVYLIKDVYSCIMNGVINVTDKDGELAEAWSNLVSLKVSTLVWKIWLKKYLLGITSLVEASWRNLKIHALMVAVERKMSCTYSSSVC